MNKIDQLKKLWGQLEGSEIRVVDAPKDAQTFDKMIVVFAESMPMYVGNPTRKNIRRVSLYNSVTDTIISEY
jgi:hypothetical protein